MNVPTLEDLPDPSGKRVLLRADFNVPVTDGKIDDDLRIRAALPTIQWLQEHGATVVACTHFGRPKGKPDEKYSVAPVRERLAELAPGVELLENLRFDPGEEANDPAFVDRLVEGFDLYVNDAFGASHRSHASVVGPPERLPSAAGRLLAKEVEVLGGLLDNPARPFVAILGGAKVSDKLGVIKALLDKVDTLVVGGAMSFTFAMAQGHGVGDSLKQADWVDACKDLLAQGGDKLVLPEDVLALGPDDELEVVGPGVPDGWKGLDIGPKATAAVLRDRVDRRHPLLERAHGPVRGPPLRRGHHRPGQGGGVVPRLHHRGRGRQRRRPGQVRPRRRRRPRVHRRRGVARAHRAGRPARPGRPAKGQQCPLVSRSSPGTGR